MTRDEKIAALLNGVRELSREDLIKVAVYFTRAMLNGIDDEGIDVTYQTEILRGTKGVAVNIGEKSDTP